MDFLKELVPWIGAAATGGAPALITLAASKVTEALGYDVEPTKEAITSAIQAATPEQQIRLKEIDMNFELELKRMGYDSIEKLKAFELDNNKDARKMQMTALQQNDWFAKNFVYILATFWTVAAVVYIGFVTFGTIPEANVRFADTILGFLLGTVIATIINFFMGSAFSNKSKDETILKLSKRGQYEF